MVPSKVRGSDSQSPGRQGVSSSWPALDAFRLFMKSGDGGGSNRVLGNGGRTTAYNSSITSKQSPSIIALRPGNPREVSLTDSLASFAPSPSGCCERLWHSEATEPAKLSIALSTASRPTADCHYTRRPTPTTVGAANHLTATHFTLGQAPRTLSIDISIGLPLGEWAYTVTPRFNKFQCRPRYNTTPSGVLVVEN